LSLLLRHTRLVMLMLGALASLATAQGTDRPDNLGDSHETINGIAYRENADEYADTKYADRMCRLNLHHPVDAEGFATVVWFHPGGLTSGTPTIPEGLKNKGIAVASAGYRLSPNVEARVCLEDAAAAVAWVIEHIDWYGGDPTRVFVAGHSAGGYLASMIGLDARWLGVHGLDQNGLAGIVSVSGHSVTHFTLRAERGIPGTRAIVDDLAPLYHVRADAPPMLLISGDREKELLGRYEESAFFWRMMRVAGHERTELLELDGYDHGGVASPAMPLLLGFVDSVLTQRPAPKTP
jgi:acetyl esterase/lipase